MKKRENYFKIFALIIALMSVSIPRISQAYTYISATHSDIGLGNMLPGSFLRALSSASIDYCPTSTCSFPTQLSVMIHDNPDCGACSGFTDSKTGMFVTDGATIIDISVLAPASPFWTWENSPSSYPYGKVNGADVVIGNGSTASDFIIGVIYTYDNNVLNDNAAMDIYDVSNPGGSLTVTYNTTITLSTNAGGGARIDMIPDYNNLLSNGKPSCNRFVATWMDFTVKTPGNIGYSATLNSPSSGTTVTLVPSGGLSWADCDIAGIQRTGLSTNDNVALYTYWDAAANALLYKEWNISTGSISSTTVLSHVNGMPRIDAIDNPALQAVGNNNWLVAAMGSSGGGSSINVYSDAYPSGLGTISLPANIGLGGCPVTVGPGSSMYTIGFWDESNKKFQTNTVGFSGTMINPTGFTVDLAPSSSSEYTDNVTLSGTCNTDGANIFAGWVNRATTSPYTIYFDCKTTGMPFSFKQPSAIKKEIQPEKINVYPNPVINILTISGNHTDGDSYTIIDVSGKTVMTGSITSDDQTLNVNNLANGMYILNIITSDKTQRVQFVKE